MDTTMSEDNMVPGNGIRNKGFRQNNSPLIVDVAANQFLAMKDLEFVVVAVS